MLYSDNYPKPSGLLPQWRRRRLFGNAAFTKSRRRLLAEELSIAAARVLRVLLPLLQLFSGEIRSTEGI
jgi:hypothetical protein